MTRETNGDVWSKSQLLSKPFKPKRKQEGREPSKLQREVYHLLSAAYIGGDIGPWSPHCTPMRLAGRTTYEPDAWYIRLATNRRAFIEVKGWMRDDAAVKLKVAAAMYPEYDWFLAKKVQGEWKAYEVTAARGISRKAIQLEWL